MTDMPAVPLTDVKVVNTMIVKTNGGDNPYWDMSKILKATKTK